MNECEYCGSEFGNRCLCEANTSDPVFERSPADDWEETRCPGCHCPNPSCFCGHEWDT